jgi:hypothetical protein
MEMLRRAKACCDDPQQRLAMIRDEAYALFRLGQIGEARRILAAAEAEADRNGDATLALTARLLGFWYAVNVDTDVPHDDIDRDTSEVLATVDPDAQPELYLAAATARMQVLSIGARRDEMFELADQALPHAVAAGDQATEARLRMAWYHSLVLGSVPAAEALVQCDRMAATVAPDAWTATTQLDFRTARATLLAMLGREDEARRLVAEQAAVVEALGTETGAVEFELAALEVDQVLGDDDMLADRYERALTWLTGHDEHGWHSFYAVDYAVRLFDRLTHDEVERLVTAARDEAYPDDVAVQATWRMAEALRQLSSGEHAAAVRLADESRAWAAQGQMPAWRAALELRRGDVLSATGDTAGAVEAVATAVALFERKGDLPEQRRASARLAALTANG